MISQLLLVASVGFIGQSQMAGAEPFAQIGLSVVGGRDGCVYLDGAWRVRRGSRTPEKLEKAVPAPIVSDGRTLYRFHPNRSELLRVAETEAGLADDGVALSVPKFEWNARWAVAPDGVTGSFVKRAKFAVLERKARKVHGFAADGSSLGVLVDYSGMAKCDQVQSVGFFSETGDLLLGTGYPERKTHRFGADGREIVDTVWPMSAEAGNYRFANGRTWALAQRVREVARDAASRSAIGGSVDTMNSIAWTGEGYWLGTSRGAEFYPAANIREPSFRLGGVGAITTLALLDGRVFATVGSRICMYFLDDLPDEPMASDDYQLWHFGGYREGRVTGVAKREGKLVYGFQPKSGPAETWQFDYRITDWTHRGDRLRKLDEPPPKIDPSAAREGRWSVTCDSFRKSILRLRDENRVVSDVRGYNSWPMIQAMGETLVCTYSRDRALPADGHTIGCGTRDVYARLSRDGGRTWSGETTVAADPAAGEVNEGIGLDSSGAVLAWVRCWGWGSVRRRHELYRSTDGARFRKICSLTPDPMPMQITDPVAVPGVGLVSPWFAGDYRQNDAHSWGLLVSRDDGKTWSQRTIESGLAKKDWVTEPSLVSLGGGRLLIVGRCEGGVGNQFQVTSADGGKTWRKARTNIGDVSESTPSLVYDPKTDLIFNYYYHRGARQLKRRIAKADLVFGHPDAWPDPEVLAVGCEPRDWDAGNVNVTRFKGALDCCAWYTGSPSNAAVVVTRTAVPKGSPVPRPTNLRRNR